MSRCKVKDFALPTMITATAAKYFSTLIPTDKNQGIRFRNIKPLPIHFCLRNLKILIQTCGYGMPLFNHPHTLFFTLFTPTQTAGCTHELFKDLREMA